MRRRRRKKKEFNTIQIKFEQQSNRTTKSSTIYRLKDFERKYFVQKKKKEKQFFFIRKTEKSDANYMLMY